MRCEGLQASFARVRMADPTVLFDGNRYRMWFEAIDTGAGTSDGPGTLGYAESLNGVHWEVRDAAGAVGPAAGPVFGPGSPGGFDAYGVNAPSVVVLADAASAEPFLLWYEAADVPGSTENTIGFATSSDGVTWRRFAEPVLRPSSDLLVPLPFDSGDLEHPSAWIDPDVPPTQAGHFLLWYAADSEASGSQNAIGLAKGWMPLPPSEVQP